MSFSWKNCIETGFLHEQLTRSRKARNGEKQTTLLDIRERCCGGVSGYSDAKEHPFRAECTQYVYDNFIFGM